MTKNMSVELALLKASLSSVEFCKHGKFDNDKDRKDFRDRDNRTGTQGPAGPAGPAGPQGIQGLQGIPGPAGITQLNSSNVYQVFSNVMKFLIIQVELLLFYVTLVILS